MVQGLGFRVKGLGFRVKDAFFTHIDFSSLSASAHSVMNTFRVKGLGYRVKG